MHLLIQLAGLRLRTRTQLFIFFSLAAFIPASLVYQVLHKVTTGGMVFGYKFKMILYHWEYPHQYIAVVALIYAAVATAVSRLIAKLDGDSRRLAIFALMIGSAMLACVPGGVLWHIHDMHAGFVPKGVLFWRKIFEGVRGGVAIGWYILLVSVPFNIIGLTLGYFMTGYGIRIATQEGGCLQPKRIVSPTL